MKALKNRFERAFRMPMPEAMLRGDLQPLGGTPDTAELFGSPTAAAAPVLVQRDLRRRIEGCAEGYFLVGLWGHGANSYAFYYSVVDSWRRIFFRLPYGGLYMDNEAEGRTIAAFLREYLAFESSLVGKAKTLLAVDWMRQGFYSVTMLDGRTAEVQESLLEQPEFGRRLSLL